MSESPRYRFRVTQSDDVEVTSEGGNPRAKARFSPDRLLTLGSFSDVQQTQTTATRYFLVSRCFLYGNKGCFYDGCFL